MRGHQHALEPPRFLRFRPHGRGAAKAVARVPTDGPSAVAEGSGLKGSGSGSWLLRLDVVGVSFKMSDSGRGNAHFGVEHGAEFKMLGITVSALGVQV